MNYTEYNNQLKLPDDLYKKTLAGVKSEISKQNQIQRKKKVASLSFAATAASTFLIAVFTEERIDLFLSVFVCATKILFFADLMLANLYTSHAENS